MASSDFLLTLGSLVASFVAVAAAATKVWVAPARKKATLITIKRLDNSNVEVETSNATTDDLKKLVTAFDDLSDATDALAAIGPLVTVGDAKARNEILLPFLQRNSDSCIVTDSDGSISSKSLALRRLLGQQVIVLDPFHHLPGIMSPTTSYNPLVELRVDSRSFFDDCDFLARSLITEKPSDDRFWQNAATNLLSNLIMLVMITKREDPATLQDVRRLLLQSSEHGRVILDNAVRKAGNQFLKARMAWLLSQNERLRASVLTNVLYETEFLDDPQLGASLRNSAFSFATMKQTPTTVYILLNPADGRQVKKWYPLVMNSALRALEEFDGPVRVTTIIDNVLPLTGIDGALAPAFSYGISHGLRLWLFFNELSDARATSFVNGGTLSAVERSDTRKV